MSSQPRKPRSESARVSEEAFNAFFDRELGEGESDRFFADLRSDLPRCAEVARMQRVISLLREPIDAPDVTAGVLAAVDRKRRFLPERLRKLVTAGRLAAAGVALAGVLGLVVVERLWPGALRLTPAARPVSGIVSSTAEDAAHGVSQLAGAVTTVRVLTGAPLGAPGEVQPRRSFMDLRPGVTTAKLLPSPPSAGGDSLIVYRGAGPDTRIVLPELVYFDRNAAVVMPLGHVSPSRIGAMDWAGVSADNLFLLPVLDPARGVRAGVAAPPAVEKR